MSTSESGYLIYAAQFSRLVDASGNCHRSGSGYLLCGTTSADGGYQNSPDRGVLFSARKFLIISPLPMRTCAGSRSNSFFPCPPQAPNGYPVKRSSTKKLARGQ
jgi:hypothetical protein